MKRGLLTDFTFSKGLGNRKKDEVVEMEVTTANALKAKGFGDFELKNKVNMTFDKEVTDTTEKKDWEKLKKEIQEESDAKVKELKEQVEKAKKSEKSKDEEIKALKAELAKLRGGKDK